MSSLENHSDGVVPKSTAGEEQIVLEMSLYLYLYLYICYAIGEYIYMHMYI